VARLGWLGVFLAALAACEVPTGSVVDFAGESCLVAEAGGLDASAAIDDVAYSYEHVATCVDLAGQLDDALGGALVQTTGGQDGPPQGFIATDRGGYESSDGTGSTGVTYLLGRDYERAGKAGDPVGADLFSLSSYLVGAQPRATADGVTIAYDRVGPLVELLGQGATPPNPIRLTTAELAAPAHLLELRSTVSIVIDEPMPSGVVHHVITTPATPRAERAAGAPWQLAVHSELDADAGMFVGDSPDLLYRSQQQTYTGELRFTWTGESDASGTFTWLNEADPVVVVDCE
jgi:hypothetical protein